MNAPDGQPVTDVQCLLVPPPGFGADRNFLDSLNGVHCDPQVREALCRARDVEGIHHLLISSLR